MDTTHQDDTKARPPADDDPGGRGTAHDELARAIESLADLDPVEAGERVAELTSRLAELLDGGGD